jgi:hypothetical protein
VKPEKRADFDAAIKKIVDANRKNQGSNWLAYQPVYGENNTVYFASPQNNMAAIATSSEAFHKALKAGLGENIESLFRDIDNCTISSRGEIRRRRWDLSTNAPKNEEDLNKLTGQARWIRTTIVRVRPGHVSQFEELNATLNAVRMKTDPSRAVLVSQSLAGEPGSVFYATNLEPSLGALDSTVPGLKETLGEEAYEKYENGVAECIIGTESMIGRFLPELSNPPESIVNVTRDFWMPSNTMPVTAARAKRKE